MNNLTLQKRHEYSLFSDAEDRIFTVDFDHNVSYFLTNSKKCSLNLDSKQFEILQKFEGRVNEVVCLKYLIEDKLLFALFCDGKIETYDTVANELLHHSIDVPSSISDAKFSNDQELLAITCTNNEMLLLNKILVVKSRYDMNLEEYGANEMVNVNWGSKETQFHGPGMRDKRIVKEELYPLSKWDDSKSSISWRGDDNYFVVNFVCSKGYRVLKIFNREGILQHTSENVSGLEKNIAWKPSGSLIAASQLLPHKHEIIFFEKNGLQHGKFELNVAPNTFMIEQIAWSYDSYLLLISGFEIKIDNEEKCSRKLSQRILFYTQSNYYWYLKQSLHFTTDNFVQDVIFDENEYLLLHLMSVNGSYCTHQYDQLKTSTDDGTVLLVDANQIHLSQFGDTLVPPPLFNYSIGFGEKEHIQVVQLVHSSTMLAICLNQDILALFKLTQITKADDIKCDWEYMKINYIFANVTSDFNMAYVPIFCQKVARISEVTLPCLTEKGQLFSYMDDKIVYFDYKSSKTIQCCVQLTSPIETLSLIGDDKLLLCDNTNQFSCFDITTQSWLNHQDKLLRMNGFYDRKCSRVMIHLDSKSDWHVIVLTKNNSLYYDQTVLMKSVVSSMCMVKNKYLLFTTLDNLLYCWPMESSVAREQLGSKYPGRSVERGASLVAVSSGEAKVVVQMPRGNLEAFYPRTLVLDQVNSFLCHKQFVEAFGILRKHRINLNYICDFNFDLFINNCDLFLRQLDEAQVDWICLFLFELSNSNYYSILNNDPEATIENKVNTVCDVLRSRMVAIDEIKFIKPILLTYIKKEQPEIGEALKRVKSLSEAKQRETAVKFMLLIINVNRLFDEALGTYDFDILLLVASKSTKDPKEYMALINQFREIKDENYRKYCIDLHLERYQKCLIHLRRCEDKFEEALGLIESKHLYKEAIEIYELNQSKQDDFRFVQIWNIYGDYLLRKKYYEEAAMAYKRADNFEQAFKAYSMCFNWNMSITCARKIASDNGDFRRLVKSVAQQLELSGKHCDAAYITEKYLDDHLEAFHILLKGHEWDRAIRCFYDNGLDETLLKTEFVTEMMNFYDTTLESIEQNISTMQEHLTRLRELVDKSEQCHNSMEPDLDAYSDTSSIYDSTSLTSSDSNLSTNSLKTNRSGKMRHLKKLEQRKYILKRGSPNEDIQLVYAIKELLGKSHHLFSDAAPLLKALYDQFYVRESSILQNKLVALETQLTASIEFIWNTEKLTRRLSTDELLRTPPKLDLVKWKIVLN